MSRGVSFFRLLDEEESFLRLITPVRETVVYPVFRASSRKEIAPISIED